MIPELALAYLVASQPAPAGTPSSGVTDWEYLNPSQSRPVETLSVFIRKDDHASRHLRFELPPNLLIDTQAEGLVPLCTEPRGPSVKHSLYSLALNQARYLVVISAQSLSPRGERLDVRVFNERSVTAHSDAEEWKCWRKQFAARPATRG